MRVVRRALVLVLAVALSGCWLQPEFNSARQNFNSFENSLTPANVAGLHQIWSLPGDTGSQPLVTPTAVYTGFANTSSANVLTVRATARASGTLRWQRDFPIAPFAGSTGGLLSVANDQVLVVHDTSVFDSQFETLDPSTGATLASVSVPEKIDPTTPVVSGNLIVDRALDFSNSANPWKLEARRLDTLEPLWTAQISVFSLSDSNVLIQNGQIYLSDGRDASGAPVIHTFALDGCGAATCSPASTITVPPPPPEAGVASYDVSLRVATDDGHLIVDRVWRDTSTQVIGHDLVSLSGSGTADWNIPLEKTADPTGVAAAADSVFFVSRDSATPFGSRTLFARSSSSSWRADLLVSGTPTVAGGLVYVELDRTEGTGVAVFDAAGCGAASCSPVKILDTGTGGGGVAISVTAGTLYVSKAGNPGGQLIAYAPTSPTS
jgi:hypothetical protein